MKFVQGYSQMDIKSPWCLSSFDKVEKKAVIYKVDSILAPPAGFEKAIRDAIHTAKLDALPSTSKVRFTTGFDLTSAKGKLQKKFGKYKINDPVEIDNGGYPARIVVICDPADVPKAFESGAVLAGTSKMMMDFIYDRPQTDFVFCMENQFDIFKLNDTFQAAVNKMQIELPVCKNEKKGLYNQYVIQDIEKLELFARPLLSGDSSKTSIILGDLSMEPDQIIKNLEIVENKIIQNFKWATGKAGKASQK